MRHHRMSQVGIAGSPKSGCIGLAGAVGCLSAAAAHAQHPRACCLQAARCHGCSARLGCPSASHVWSPTRYLSTTFIFIAMHDTICKGCSWCLQRSRRVFASDVDACNLGYMMNASSPTYGICVLEGGASGARLRASRHLSTTPAWPCRHPSSPQRPSITLPQAFHPQWLRPLVPILQLPVQEAAEKVKCVPWNAQ